MLGLAFAPAALAAGVSTSASTKILEPLSLQEKRGLDFGDIFAGTADTYVNIMHDDLGLRALLHTPQPGDAVLSSTNNGHSALYWVSGTAGYEFRVLHTDSTILSRINGTGPGPTTMLVTVLVSTPMESESTELLSGTPQAEVWVGGTLKVKANQAPGFYSGTFTMSVEYL